MSRPTLARWTNWSGNISCVPQDVVHPETVDDLARLITAASHAGRCVKVVGVGHSFNDIAATDGLLLCLDRLSGLTDVDYDTGLVTVLAGTTIAELNISLAAAGLPLENLGDIDRQSVAGAISTGTHGSGADFGGLATQVRALTMITADGSQLHCSRVDHPDIFAAARIGLGALGVISEITLQCVSSFRLRAMEGPARLADILDGFGALLAENDHVDIHWFPHTRPGADQAQQLSSP